MLPEDVSARVLTFVPMYNDNPAEGLDPKSLDVEEDQWQNQPCLWVWSRHVFTGWKKMEGYNVYGEFRDAERINYKVTFKVKNGSWNDGSKNDRETTLSRWEDEDLALTLENGDIPLVGDKPDNGYSAGSWDTDPADYATLGNYQITSNKTFTYTYSGSGPIPPSPTPHTRSRDDEDDHHDDEPTPAPKPVNPNVIVGFSFIGTPAGNVKIGPQVQGSVAQFTFKLNTSKGWKEAFSFNMTVNDKTDYTPKKGVLSFKIPTQYLKAGRKFAILGLDENGNVKVFNDTDTKADSITINLDIEGYAFDLIYFD